MTESPTERIETPQMTLVRATIAILEAEDALFEALQRWRDECPPLTADIFQNPLFQELQSSRDRFQEVLGADALGESSWDRFYDGGVGIGEPWPEPCDEFSSRELEMLHLRSNPATRWGMWYLLFKRPLSTYDKIMLIGTASFKNPPSSEDTAEIGYWFIDRYQSVDLASEVVGALVTYAFEDPRVHRVVAKASPRHIPTIRVLGKNGFRRVGAPTTSGYLLLQRDR